MEWRRFELVNPDQENKLSELCDSKGLTREDLLLICSTIKLKNEFKATEELVKELQSRKNVQKISVGPYEPYDLREKYVRHCGSDGTRGQIISDCVLLVNHVDAR